MGFDSLKSSSILLCLATIACGLPACSSTDAAAAGDDSHLSKSGRDDLAAIDAQRFVGKAVITSEEEQDNGFTKVTFDPASGPICLEGGEFTAFYADRGSDKTMVILNGGGACWSSLCAATPTASVRAAPIGPAADGPDRYFGDWNVVIASYCDGSVFSGNNEVTLPNGSTRYHHGSQNLTAAMDIAKEHFGDSKQVLVGGFSAGGYGTLPGMVLGRLYYPKADLFVMDDSGPAVQNLDQPQGIEERLAEWKFADSIPASCTVCNEGRGELTGMFSWMLERDPNVKISVLSYFEDGVIGGFFLGLPGPEYKALLTTETGKVQSAHPDRFKRYMLPGTSHVVSAGWRTVTADGVAVSDWTAGMVKGDAVWKDLLAAGP